MNPRVLLVLAMLAANAQAAVANDRGVRYEFGDRADVRAEDERTIIYWLEDPGSQRISLALEMLITTPGQAHVYSGLWSTPPICHICSATIPSAKPLLETSQGVMATSMNCSGMNCSGSNGTSIVQ